MLQPECPRTPLSLKVLAATLRDLSGRATCPFGADFMSDSNELAPRQLVCLKPQLVHLLALMELHQNGYRYAAEYNQKSPPLSYAALAEEVHRQRAAAAPVHDLTTVEALANALQRNPALQNSRGWWMLSLFTASPLTCSPEEHFVRRCSEHSEHFARRCSEHFSFQVQVTGCRTDCERVPADRRQA